jgi:putative heme-binding domain-containing protein
LETIADDSDVEIRTAVARLCGVVDNADKLNVRLLSDGNAMVRRVAAESALRQKTRPPIETLIPMLKSYDRNEALVARRLLERIPTFEWRDHLLSSNDTRVFIQTAASLMIAEPSLPNSYKVLARASKVMDGFVNDADFVDVLRVAQLAMIRGNVDPQKIPAFGIRIAREFPSGNSLINQELVRLLAYMKYSQLDGRLEAWLESEETPRVDKLHVALLMQTIGRTLPAKSKISIIKTLEELKNSAEPDVDVAYLRRGIRDVTSTIDINQIPTILENGDQWTDATLATLFLLPRQLDAETVAQIQRIDAAVKDREGESIEHLRTGIIAVFAQSGDQDSMDYLRELWTQEPERRSEISLGLAQHPNEDNWGYLVSSLSSLDDMTGNEVLGKLVSVSRRPRDAQHYRNVIDLGYRLRGEGISKTVRLLEHWSQAKRPNEGKSWKETMDDWKNWYDVTFPESEPILVGNETAQNGVSTAAILEQIELLEDSNIMNGHAVFQSANCAKCHRCRGTGNAIGPELTDLASRYTQREMIEAIVNPNAHVADRYRASVIQLEDGREIEGMAAVDVDESLVVLLANGDRVRFAADEIEAKKLVETSPMPEGSIDDLTPQEIADLLSFMGDVSRTANSSSTTLK